MVNDLAVARFNKTDRTDAVQPCDALHAALADEDVQNADHVIVLYGRVDEEGFVQSGWFQGGKLDPYAQLGLIECTKLRIVGEMQ